MTIILKYLIFPYEKAKKYKQLILPEDKKTNIIKEKSNRSIFSYLKVK